MASAWVIKIFFMKLLTSTTDPSSLVGNSNGQIRSLALTGFLCVPYRNYSLTTSNYKSYSQFNSVSLQARVYNAEIVTTATGKFLAVTLITNLKDGDDGVTVTFNNSNGLMSLFEKGYLPNGRMVTVTGHIDNISETYTDKTGELKMRMRPQMHLVQAVAHVGPMPQDKATPAAKKGRTVVRPSDAAKKSADALLEEITPEEAYASDEYANIPM